MTISTPIAKAVFLTNSAVTDYAYPFKIFKPEQVAVIVAGAAGAVTLALGADYGVIGVGAEQGGAVRLTAAGQGKAGTGNKLILVRNMPFVQLTDYTPHDVFPAETHERAIDILTMQDQELLEKLSRALLAPIGEEPITWEDLIKLRDEAAASAAGARAAEVGAGASATAAAGSAAEARAAEAGAERAAEAADDARIAAKVSEGRARDSAAAAGGYADRAEELLEGMVVDQQLWVTAINAVRVTEAGLRRSMEIFKLGGF